MPHIRILRHYIHTPLLILAALEGAVLVASVYLGYRIRMGVLPDQPYYILSAIMYALIIVVSMVSMGVYEARIKEGFIGTLLRTAVAIFLIGSMGVAIVFYFLPSLSLGRGVLAVSSLTAFGLITVLRWLQSLYVGDGHFKRRVLVLGTGRRAYTIASRMRRTYDQRGFNLLGFLDLGDDVDLVSEHGGRILETDDSLKDFCARERIEEIVVAVDERRRNRDTGGGLPLDDLFECRLRGIEVCDVQAFIERETGKVDIDLLQPSWMVFSDGFVQGLWRTGSKRAFDVLASLAILLVTWPVMLVTAFAILAEAGFRGPVLYRQQRVGLDGRPFEVAKFRSMSMDAECDGKAVWATENDPRVTRVGNVIRRARIDELPQLFNVLRGDMSFVGPRPERPEFVSQLNDTIPFYDYRHRVKPGITGWAQLCYPYGASFDDAKYKLQYDLYYLKNHSVLLDLIILVQTVEVVLVGEGAR